MKIDTRTVVRTILMILTWINMFLATQGLSPIPLNEQEISVILMVIMNGWTWFKNNNITVEAHWAQAKLDKYKAEKKYNKATGSTPTINHFDETHGGTL
ncbi:phage holin [Macrococcus sp. EM39E]|uniref:phage holin n=1 Tax=Macrococcus animalis TaxID=3395467 RepID=UPI0039BEA234